MLESEGPLVGTALVAATTQEPGAQRAPLLGVPVASAPDGDDKALLNFLPSHGAFLKAIDQRLAVLRRNGQDGTGTIGAEVHDSIRVALTL